MKIKESQTTNESWFINRRSLVIGAGGALSLAALSGASTALAQAQGALGAKKTPYGSGLVPTKYEDAISYNNFYEFGTDKSDPGKKASAMRLTPWSVKISGLVETPMIMTLEDLLKLSPMEERLYRLRCVEGWSMVIPWIGYSLSHLVKAAKPLGSAKFVEFRTLSDAAVMPGLQSGVLEWPYVEGLRMDEAMHPLSLLTFGAYGKMLLGQSGAPVRIMLPWKYGFKSAKSLVEIRFTEQMPRTSWVKAASGEYGFYANVNPQVAHPRWSQSTERVIGAGLFAPRQKTLMFNGYPEVESLYRGMDLVRNF